MPTVSDPAGVCCATLGKVSDLDEARSDLAALRAQQVERGRTLSDLADLPARSADVA